MNKVFPLISLFIISIISVFYWTLKSKNELYDAKWNAPDTTLAITINGEISTTFPTTNAYTGTVECTTGTGKVEWNGTKWVLTTSGITKGSTKCNATFRTPNFADTILANNEVKNPITTPGAAISTADEALLASAEDDYGTSYYFRGAVTNNYVEFANKCWRIVRVGGDGSVKLILHNDNTAGAANPCSSANNSTNAAFARYSGTTYESAFNTNYNDNAYIGFMYGTAGASDYATTHANINKSTILKNLESWYTNNLASYESKLADTIWCNDKSTFSTYTSGSTYGTGLGYGTNQTGYGADNRIYGGNAASYASPSLVCPNDNNGGKLSKFTVDDTANGNGNLTYKIGLLTADEIAFAGSIYGTHNCSTYLQENTGAYMWWSLSPCNFDGSGAYVWDVGLGSLERNFVSNGNGLRPSISLISSTTISRGTGTSEDPYVVN